MAMRTVTARFALLVGLGLLCCAGCNKPTHESLAADSIDKVKEMGTILKTVTDEASAKSAADKIKGIAADLKKLKEQGDKLPKPTAEDDKKLEEKYGKQMGEAMTAMMAEMMRIGMNPKLAEPLQKAMDEVQNSMK